MFQFQEKPKENILNIFSGNKTMWKVVKLFLFEKILSKEQIAFIKSNEIISKDSDVVQTLNFSFWNIQS